MANLQSITADVRAHVAKSPKMLEIQTSIERLSDDEREESEKSFLVMVDAFLIGDGSTAKDALLAAAGDLHEALGREVISADMGALSGQHLSARLKLGYETVTYQLSQLVSSEWAEFVNHVFQHNKGYPRLINFAQTYTPLRQRTVRSVLEDRLNGFSNTNIVTKGKDSRAVKAQLSAGWATFTEKEKDSVWEELFGTVAMQLKVTGYGPTQFKAFIRMNWAHVRGALTGIIPDADITQALYDKKLSAIAKGLSALSIIGD